MTGIKPRQAFYSILFSHDDIEVVVLEVRGEQIRLGIKAPRDVVVHRKEIYDQIQEENKAASTVDPKDVPDEA